MALRPRPDEGLIVDKYTEQCFLLVKDHNARYPSDTERHYHEKNEGKAVVYACRLAYDRLILSLGEPDSEDPSFTFSYEDLDEVCNGEVISLRRSREKSEWQLGFGNVPGKNVQLVISPWEKDPRDGVEKRKVYREFTNIQMSSTKIGSFGVKTLLEGTFRTKPIVVEKVILKVWL